MGLACTATGCPAASEPGYGATASACTPTTVDEAVDQLVDARLARQRIFDRPDPPNLWIVLGEPVLHWLIGTPKTTCDQLVQVADMSMRSSTAGASPATATTAAVSVWRVCALAEADRVLIRDTKDRRRSVLRFSPAAWRRFAARVKQHR